MTLVSERKVVCARCLSCCAQLWVKRKDFRTVFLGVIMNSPPSDIYFANIIPLKRG